MADGEPVRAAVRELALFLGTSVEDPGFLADPNRCLTPAMRARSVHRLPGGALAVLGHAACAEVLGDARFGHGAGELYETSLLGLPARSFLQLDAPAHTRLRGQVARYFSGRRVRVLAERVTRHSRELVHGCPDGPGDFVAGVAEPLAMAVMSEVLGVPDQERKAFRRDARLVVQGLDHPARVLDEPAVARARFRLVRFFHRQAARPRGPAEQDGLLSTLLRPPDGPPADIREAVTTCGLLLSAGYDTTVSLLSHAVAQLSGDRSGRLWALARDPALVDAVVEEVLRLHSPVQVAPRAALCDVVLRGVPAARGTVVLPLLAAANRDPDVFDAPHAFRPRRHLPRDGGSRAARHLALGAGAHFCLGAALARLTARTALSVLAGRPPRLREAPRDYQNNVVVRGLRRLPVDWPPRRTATAPHPSSGDPAPAEDTAPGGGAAPTCPVLHPRGAAHDQ
ncbi:cytochrome P450 [Streptomyces sp. LP05-1]|uniref:Cytochrome P450 n=1 Tax=Streptomyces pyxinae TaxID=2970734 RepID=A0ABT2CJ09_9ACTN|nr:cytochrome P450 [Streptomyces sp. LP05-1]MCS0636691.1 cytochrome P450 [Streptomyces sp. LP05-1]